MKRGGTGGAAVLLVLVWAVAAQAADEMVLKKQPFFGGIGPRYNQDCFGLYYIPLDKDVQDLRDFRLFYCNGRYTFSIQGPAEKTVTLFAAFDYKIDNGYLIVKKTDNRLIWVYELEDFPKRQWVTVPPSDDDRYGGYEAYFEPGNLFEQYIGSVKWGKWWQTEPPPPNPNRP